MNRIRRASQKPLVRSQARVPVAQGRRQELLSRLSRYFSEWMHPLASVRTSKGCPFRCNFCRMWRLAGGHYLRRRPENVVEELAGVAEPYVFFADDELNLAGFAVLTPLPGTGFYDEVKDQLTTDNYDLYDFFHTVLPTTLPLEQFHREYRDLAASAVPLRRSLELLRLWPLHELPSVLARQSRWLGRLRRAPQDYDSGALQIKV